MADELQQGADFYNSLVNTSRRNDAYNALAKTYGPIAGDPELATATANAQTTMANQPNIQAANDAKAAALTAAQNQFGPSAGNPAAQTSNLANQETAETNNRQAQVRGVRMLQATIAPGSDSVDPAAFDKVVGANAKTLGLTDPDQLAQFKAAVTAPGGAKHLDGIAQALLAPTKVSGSTTVVRNADGTTSLARTDQYGNPIETPLAPGQTTAPLMNADTNRSKVPILQENADTNRAGLPIKQQNANTAAYSANTRSNNSNFGNPGGQAPQGSLPGDNRPSANFGGGNTLPKPSVDLIHAGNADGTATTPTFERLAPAGSKARATAIGSATQIVNQDTQLKNTNQIINKVQGQISPYTAGTGSLIDKLPGSAANDLRANLSSLKASGQMAWIASLKNASGQTGIGRVLQSEAKNAETLFGNMEQDQTTQQLQLHLRLFQQTVNQLHNTAQSAFKAQWGQDPYALLGQSPGKGGAGGAAAPTDAATAAAYKKYGL